MKGLMSTFLLILFFSTIFALSLTLHPNLKGPCVPTKIQQGTQIRHITTRLHCTLIQSYISRFPFHGCATAPTRSKIRVFAKLGLLGYPTSNQLDQVRVHWGAQELMGLCSNRPLTKRGNDPFYFCAVLQTGSVRRGLNIVYFQTVRRGLNIFYFNPVMQRELQITLQFYQHAKKTHTFCGLISFCTTPFPFLSIHLNLFFTFFSFSRSVSFQ